MQAARPDGGGVQVKQLERSGAKEPEDDLWRKLASKGKHWAMELID